MSDDLKGMVIQSLTDITTKANDAATKIAAATTDRTKMVHDYLTADEPADEKIREFQEWEEKALAQIEKAREAAAEHVTATYLQTVDASAVDALKETYKTLADKAKTARKYFLNNIPDATEDDLKDVPALKTLRGGTSGGGGGKRPRFNSISYRIGASGEWVEVSAQAKNAKGEDVTVTNMTVLAKALKEATGTKVEVKDLQAAAFDAAGTDDLSSLNGKVVEFAHSVGDKNVFVKAQPKSADDE